MKVILEIIREKKNHDLDNALGANLGHVSLDFYYQTVNFKFCTIRRRRFMANRVDLLRR